MQPDSGVHFEI